ncbi:hypothetical protein MBH78_11555 [Oceanimonas sp. NS1]|nr:hypothetical protein [Oceanimonas sp. NS1]
MMGDIAFHQHNTHLTKAQVLGGNKSIGKCISIVFITLGNTFRNGDQLLQETSLPIKAENGAAISSKG